MGSNFHYLKRRNYEHHNNAFSLTPKTVNVQKKYVYNIWIIVTMLPYLPYPKGLNPWPMGHEFYNIDRWLHRHELSFSKIYLGVAKMFIKTRYIFIIWPYCPCPMAWTTDSGVVDFTIQVEVFCHAFSFLKYIWE